MTTNRHPVDELADVREKIKALQKHEQILREWILNGGDTIGDEYEAEVVMQRRETLDTREIKRQFGRERLAQFMRTAEVAIVKLERLGTNDANEWTD